MGNCLAGITFGPAHTPMATTPLTTLLGRHHITEPGFYYTFPAQMLPWWDDEAAAQLEIGYFANEQGQIECTAYLLPYVEDETDRPLVYMLALGANQQLLEPALIDEEVLEHTSGLDLPFDEDQGGCTTNHPTVALKLLEGLLRLAKGTKPERWTVEVTDDYEHEYVPGFTLDHFLSMMTPEQDAASPETVKAFLDLAMRMEGPEYLKELRIDLQQTKPDPAQKGLTTDQWKWITQGIQSYRP